VSAIKVVTLTINKMVTRAFEKLKWSQFLVNLILKFFLFLISLMTSVTLWRQFLWSIARLNTENSYDIYIYMSIYG